MKLKDILKETKNKPVDISINLNKALKSYLSGGWDISNVNVPKLKRALQRPMYRDDPGFGSVKWIEDMLTTYDDVYPGGLDYFGFKLGRELLDKYTIK